MDFLEEAGFAIATTLEPLAGGTFGAALHPDWTVGGIPNGGYLLALLALAGNRALGGSPADGPSPVSASAYFVQRTAVGPVEIEVTPLRAGRTLRHVGAVLRQDGEPRVHALLAFADLGDEAPADWAGHRPVDLPPERECPRVPVSAPGVGFDVGIMGVVEQRLDPATVHRAAEAAAAGGAPSGEAELRGWLRFPEVARVDPYRLLFALDALPPATFPLGMRGWVPTVELTANIRALPAAGPLRARQRARSVQAGFVDETCELWDSAGQLVAHATQLARAPRDPR